LPAGTDVAMHAQIASAALHSIALRARPGDARVELISR